MAEGHDSARGCSGGRGAVRWLRAGVVARPHSLDGAFYVGDPKPELLIAGAIVMLAGKEHAIIRRAGTDRRPIIALEGCEDRAGAESLRGIPLLVERSQAPQLDEDEWWADDLEGCAVSDGRHHVGTVTRLLALPSCEALEVARIDGAGALLVPLLRDAVRSVDVERKQIEIDLRFLGQE